MNIKITTRHIKDRKIAKKMKKYMVSKLPRLGRYLYKRGEEATISAVLSSEKLRHTAEVKVVGTRLSATASVTSDDLNSSIDNVMDAVTKQLRRKGDKRISKRRRNSSGVATSQSRPNAAEVKVQRVAAKPMSFEEAALQITDSGKEFVAFINSDTEEMNVAYKKDKHVIVVVP